MSYPRALERRPAHRGYHRRTGLSRDSGMVTAETAMVFPVLVIVLVLTVFALSCVAAQLRCVDAARAAARLAARGEPTGAVSAAGRSLAPKDASVQVTSTAETVEVRVTAVVDPFRGVLARMPGVPVGARAVAPREDSFGEQEADEP